MTSNINDKPNIKSDLVRQRITDIPYRQGSLSSAKIAFVGEAPGAHEAADDQKRPFIGPSGQLLRSWLKQSGINESEYYMTNVLKERPPHNNFKVFVKENPQTLKSHIELLRIELGLLENCNVIVPCGNQALNVITGLSGIVNWRGSVVRSRFLGTQKEKKCIPIIHPAAIMRQWGFLAATFLDLKRIKEDSYFPKLRLPERKYIIRPTFNRVMEFLCDLIENTANVSDYPGSGSDSKSVPKKEDIISVDTETKEGGRIVTIQFCNNSKTALCIPFQYGNGTSYWTLDQEIIIWKTIETILHNKFLVGQNFLMYDTFILGVQGFDPWRILSNVYLDTMEAFQCYQPTLPKNLGFLTSIYTREPFYKQEGKETIGMKDWSPSISDDKFWTYGCKDVLVVHEMFDKIRDDLIRHNLWNFYKKRYQGMAKNRLKMTFRGIKVDTEHKENLKKKVFRAAILDQSKLTMAAGSNINVRSSPQMKKLLYADMKMPVQRLPTGQVTCNEDAILKLASERPSEIFDLILKVRHNRTLWSNYINVKSDSDGRIRSSYGFTETGRFTSYKCPFRTGYNLQNWPPDMRIMLRSDDDDHVLIEMDLSQAESRAVAWKSRDEELIEAYQTGIDVHKQTAANIFQITMNVVTPTQRYTGKRVNHAANYDMGVRKFAIVYNKDAAKNKVDLIGTQLATIFMSRHHAAHPSIRNVYHKELMEEVSKAKTLFSIWGRRVTFHDRLGPDLYRQAYAWWAQSLVGELTNIIFEKIAERVRVVNQGHDSLLAHTHKSRVRETMKIMWEAAQIPLQIEGRELVIPVDFKVGTHWGNTMKEIEYDAAA